MKKHLFFAAIVLGATLMAGCKKNDPENPVTPPEGETTLTVSPKSLNLVLGENAVALTATLNPAVAGATIDWLSSDPEVATVTSRGYVEATGYGDCYIIASYEKLSDTCFVHVQTFLESVVFSSAILWDVDTAYLADPETGEIPTYEIESSAGESFNAYVALGTIFVCSDGLYWNNSGYLDGSKEGVIMEINAPMYYASKYTNPGQENNYNFCLGAWGVVDNPEYMKQSLPGYVDEVEYIKQMKGFVEALNNGDDSYATFLQGAGEAVKAPNLSVYEYISSDGNSGYSSSYIPDAICLSADLSLNAEFPASQYMCGLDYCNVTFQQMAMDTVFGKNFGLNLGYDLENDLVFFNDEKVHYDDPITSNYQNESDSEAPAMQALNLPIITRDYPEIAARMKEQMKNNSKIIVLRKKN